jgi:hypothetical protein
MNELELARRFWSCATSLARQLTRVLLFDLVRALARPAADAHATARLYIDLAGRIVQPVCPCSFFTTSKRCSVLLI